MLYRMLRGIATIALRWFYRHIEVVGLEQFPSTGPVIVAANHWNALIDALIYRGDPSGRGVGATRSLDPPVARALDRPHDLDERG